MNGMFGRFHHRTWRWAMIFALMATFVANPTWSGRVFAAGGDALSGATDITTLLPYSDSQDTTTATRDAGEIGTCGSFPATGNTHSVWYKYNAASTGWLHVSTLGSNYDTALEVFSGPASPSFATLTSIGCNDDVVAGTRQSELTVPVRAASNYYTVARTFSAGTGGMLQFSASFATQQHIYVDQSTGYDSYPGTAALPVRTIQRGVDLASAGAVIDVAAGSYGETVTVAKPLTFTGTGAPTVDALTLSASVANSTGILAAQVTVNTGGAIQDGVLLVQPNGMVTVGTGTYTENVTVNKALTLRSTTGATVQPASGAAFTVSVGSVTITGFNILSASALNNTGGAPVSAKSNWWGSASGPKDSVGNPSGTGGTVTGMVDYRPWCTVAAPTCSATGGVATLLVFSSQPSNGQVGQPLPTQPVVVARDASGNTDTSFSGPVTLAIATGTGTTGASLGGTVTVNAVAGVATFSGVSVNKAGTGYQLTAMSNGLSSATSNAFSIVKGNQTITFGPLANKQVGDAPFTVSATASSSLPVSFTATGQCSISGTTVSITGVGTCTVTASQAGNADYNAAPSVSQTFTINKGNQTITFGPLAPVSYGVAPFTISATASSGLPVSFSATPGSVCTVSGNTVTVTGVGTCTITAAQAGDANYNPASPVDQNLVVGKADQTITFAALADRAYSTTPFNLTATASSGLPVSYSATGTCTVSGSAVTMTGVGTCTITASQAGDANYNAATDVVQSFNVGKGDQAITFNPLSDQPVNAAPFTVSASASSGLPVSFAATGVCSVSGTTVTLSGATGTCTITASQAGDANYNAATDVSQSFNVVLANQTINFGPLADKQFGDAPFAVSATASSGLAVSFSSTTTSVCTVSGSTVTIVGAGVCTIKASQAGDATYSAAPDVLQSFNVQKQTATVTLNLPTGAVYDGTAKVATASTTPSGLNVDITYNGSTTAPVNAGSYAVVATINDSNYQGSATGTLVIGKASATVTVANVSVVYDGTGKTVTATTNPAGLNLTFTYNGSGRPPINAGTYTVVATVADPNYAGSGSGTLTITKAAATITLANLSQVYDGSPRQPTATTTPAGLAVQITYTGINGTTYGPSTTAPTNAGSYTVDATVSDTNYSGSASGTLDVAKADQTIDFAALQNRIYTNPPFTLNANASSSLTVSFTASGVCTVSGTTVTLTGVLGTCTITASQTGDGNYQPAADVTRSFTVFQSYLTFMPTLMRPAAPADLSIARFTVTPMTLKSGDSVQISAVVRNTGETATGGFWVDLYINPNTAPTAANIPWNEDCGSLKPCYGIAWYVDNLAAGASITLTSDQGSYFAKNSNWVNTFAPGTSDLYLYVDSWNRDNSTGARVPAGAVLESNETNNRAEIHGLSVSPGAALPAANNPLSLPARS